MKQTLYASQIELQVQVNAMHAIFDCKKSNKINVFMIETKRPPAFLNLK